MLLTRITLFLWKTSWWLQRWQSTHILVPRLFTYAQTEIDCASAQIIASVISDLLSSHCPVLTFLLEIKQSQAACALTLVPGSGSPHKEEKRCVILCSTRESSFKHLSASIQLIPAHLLLGFNSHFPFIFSSPGWMRRLFSVSEVSVLTSEYAQRHERFMCPMVGSRNGGWMFVHRRFCNQ